MTETHGLGSYVANAALSFLKTHVTEKKAAASVSSLGLLVTRSYSQSWPVAILVGAAAYAFSHITAQFLNVKAATADPLKEALPFSRSALEESPRSFLNTPISTPPPLSLSVNLDEAPIPTLSLDFPSPASCAEQPYVVRDLVLNGRCLVRNGKEFDPEVADIINRMKKIILVKPHRKCIPTLRAKYATIGSEGW